MEEKPDALKEWESVKERVCCLCHVIVYDGYGGVNEDCMISMEGGQGSDPDRVTNILRFRTQTKILGSDG